MLFLFRLAGFTPAIMEEIWSGDPDESTPCQSNLKIVHSSFLFLGGQMARKVQIYQPIGEAYIMSNSSSNYGCGMFLLDCVLTLVTGGLWLIWVFVREMRKR